MRDRYDLAWNLLVELRKEITNSQRLRNQIIGFKITLVITGGVLLAANMKKILPPLDAPVITALPLGAIFFDLLISGLSMSIKRIGFYNRNYLEPILKDRSTWPTESKLWEEFEGQFGYWSSPSAALGALSNLGLTGIFAITALIRLYSTSSWIWFWVLSVASFADLAVTFIFNLTPFSESGTVQWWKHRIQRWIHRVTRRL